MNQLKKGIFALLFVATLGVANAQEVAHIDAQQLLSLMPETKAANEELTKLTEGYQVEIKKMENEIKAVTDKLKPFEQKDPATITTQERTTIQGYVKDYQERLEKLGEFREQAGKTLEQNRVRLLTPLEKKAQDAINAAAAKKGVKYVLDASSVLYYNGGYNLLEDVKKELGIK